ncbi:MAG: oligosaccharide flippase family protein [Pseudomonadota bacterium]|nr:oligosaccharide flippase family protein [Pseudomonadota bacterium]
MLRKLASLLTGEGLGATLIRASLGSAGLRIAGLAFGFLLALQLARVLGPSSYGIYGTAMAIVAILTAAADLGTARLVTREVAKAEAARDWARMRGVLHWSRRLALTLSIGFIIAVASWTWLGWNSDPILLTTLLIGAVSVPLVTLANIDAAALAGLRHFIKGQLPEVVLRPALFSLFLFMASLLAIPLSPTSAIALSVASAAFGYATAAVFLRRTLPPELRLERPIVEAKAWFRSALPIALSDAVRVGQAQLAVLILAAMADDVTTGTFRAAASIAVLFVVPEAMFNLICAPIMARLHSQGEHARLQRMLFWAAAASTLATSLLVSPFLLFGEGLVALLLGEEFRAASAPLEALGIAAILIAATGPGLVLMNVAGHDREVVAAGAISLLVLVITAGPLIMFMGATGAAVSFGFSSFLWRAIVRHRGLRILHLDPSLASFRRTAAV